MNATKINTANLTIKDNESYITTMVLLENDTIVIDMEEILTKVQYKGQFTVSDIEGMLENAIRVTIEQFYDILVAGLLKGDQNMNLKGTMGLSGGIRLTLVWTIPNSIALVIPMTFVLDIAPLVQDEFYRVNKVVKGLNDKIDTLNNTVVTDVKSAIHNTYDCLSTKISNVNERFNTVFCKISNVEGTFKSDLDETYDCLSAKISNVNERINFVKEDILFTENDKNIRLRAAAETLTNMDNTITTLSNKMETVEAGIVSMGSDIRTDVIILHNKVDTEITKLNVIDNQLSTNILTLQTNLDEKDQQITVLWAELNRIKNIVLILSDKMTTVDADLVVKDQQIISLQTQINTIQNPV